MDTAIVKQGKITEVYLFGTIIGEGSFGVVRKAKSKQTQEEFAVKIIDKAKLEQDQLSLYSEIEILSQLDHPNIVKLHEVWEDQRKLYLVMDLMSGGELYDRIVEKEHLSEQEAAHVLRPVSEAIAYCHSLNIAHRDLKPENMLYKTREPDSPLMVSDFGFSRIYEDADLMITACGTPGYCAPEILSGIGYTNAVDIWSLGITLYVLLCGFPPFYDESNEKLFEKILSGEFEFPSPFWDNVSDDAKDLIRKMIVVNAEMRIGIQEILSHPWMVANLHSNDAEYIPDTVTQEKKPQRGEERAE